METEEPMQGGNVTKVVRTTEGVARETGPWTPAVHALLNHLETVGFTGCPRFICCDIHGREVLSFLPGQTMKRPWTSFFRSLEGIRMYGKWIRAFHDAVAGFVPPSDSQWRCSTGTISAGQIMCHGDLGPWNSVWENNRLVGFIDWDFAEPGPREQDLADAALTAVPLRNDDHCTDCGFDAPPDRLARLQALCEGYGGVKATAVLSQRPPA